MTQFSVTVSQATIDGLEKAIGKTATKQAIYQSVLRTTRAGTTIIRKRVQESLNLDAKYVNRVVTTNVRGTALDTAEAVGHITVSHELIPLIAFGDRSAGKQGGITVVISKNRAPLYLRHAFYATVGKGGHKGIFFRAEGRDSSGGKVEKGTYNHLKVGRYEGGVLTRGGYARRFPIEEQFSTSVVDAIGPDKLTEMGEKVIEDLGSTMQKNLTSQLERFGGEVADAG